MEDEETRHGRMGYEEYARTTGGRTFDGRNMPGWDELPERIRTAWKSAVAVVATEVRLQAQAGRAG